MFKWNDYVLGDAFDGMAQIPDQSVDLVFSGLPDLTQTEFDKKSVDQFQEFEFRALAEFCRIVKPDGFVVLPRTDRMVNGSILCHHYYYIDYMLNHGFMVKDEKIIVKNRVGIKDFFRFTYQYLTVFTKTGKIPTKKRSGDWLLDIIVDKQPMIMPGQYTWSQDFCRLVIETLTELGDSVVDPFAAVGPVLFAAKNLGRKYWGAEICPERYNKDFSLFGGTLDV